MNARQRLALLVIGVIPAGVMGAAPNTAVTLTGSYRTALSAGDLIRAGAPSVESADETGTWTLRFAKRSWTLRQEHAPDQNALDRGVVVVVGDRVRFTLLTSDGAPHRVFLGTFRWTLRQRTLRFSLLADQFSTSAEAVLIAEPWKPIR